MVFSKFEMKLPVLNIAAFTALYVVSRATKVKAFLLGACMKHVILALAVVAQLTDLIFEEAIIIVSSRNERKINGHTGDLNHLRGTGLITDSS